MELVLNLKDLSNRLKIKRVSKALCDLMRLEIISLISQGDENLNYGEISKKVGRSPTSITNHMNWIRNSGLIEDLVVEGKRGKMQKIPKLKLKKITINLV